MVVVLDDTGFGDLGCYGGLGGRVKTPNIDQLATSGIVYNNFHVNPMCSPTRAALLTGRNHHSVGVGSIMELARGYPGYNGRIPKEAAMLPAVLRSEGYSTMALGKWHLTPVEDITPIGPFDLWPLGQGFGRFYGFLRAEVDQYRPELTEDNHSVAAPFGEAGGRYHLSEDLVDHAITWVAEHRAVAPSRPFFCYLAFGAMHQPHQVWPEWSDRYRGAFADGWDVGAPPKPRDAERPRGGPERGPSCRRLTPEYRRGRTFQCLSAVSASVRSRFTPVSCPTPTTR